MNINLENECEGLNPESDCERVFDEIMEMADYGGASLPMKAHPCSFCLPLFDCFYVSCPAGTRHKQTNRNLCVSQR